MHFAHVPIPLSEAGSSVTTVIRHLCEKHSGEGGVSTVITSDNRDVTVAAATNVAVDYGRYCPRGWFTPTEMRFDHALGALGFKRRFSGRMFIPAIEATTRLDPDALFLHEGHYATASLPYWNELWPGKTILYVHTPLSRAYRRPELRRLLVLARGIVFVSDYARDAVEHRVGRLPCLSTVVRNGVDSRVFHPRGRPAPPHDQLRVTFAGEVAPHKGVHLMLDAVKKSGEPAAARVIGSARHAAGLGLSDYEVALRQQATAMNVEFIPYQPPDALARLLRESDVVCVPSTWDEPFGMIALEAMASGAAVIASRRGGLPEAAGEAARYVDPEDLDGFAEAVVAMADPERRLARQERGLQLVRERSWEAAYGRLRHWLVASLGVTE
jgi:glycosyltransferase involved in cell wall biosynthesis